MRIWETNASEVLGLHVHEVLELPGILEYNWFIFLLIKLVAVLALPFGRLECHYFSSNFGFFLCLIWLLYLVTSELLW